MKRSTCVYVCVCVWMRQRGTMGASLVDERRAVEGPSDSAGLCPSSTAGPSVDGRRHDCRCRRRRRRRRRLLQTDRTGPGRTGPGRAGPSTALDCGRHRPTDARAGQTRSSIYEHVTRSLASSAAAAAPVQFIARNCCATRYCELGLVGSGLAALRCLDFFTLRPFLVLVSRRSLRACRARLTAAAAPVITLTVITTSATVATVRMHCFKRGVTNQCIALTAATVVVYTTLFHHL